jgi:adenine-specific DNA-methyltransferase
MPRRPIRLPSREIDDVLSGRRRFVSIRARVEDVESLMPIDGPYHRVKPHCWDNEHDDERAFLAWKGERYAVWRRILAPNGTLYDFTSPRMGARVEIACREHFEVIANIRWEKERDRGRHAGCSKETLRSFFPNSETIVVAEQRGSDSLALGESRYGAACDELRGFVFEPLRAYFDGERARSGLSADVIRSGMHARTGRRYVFERHTFSRSQWELPTAEQYVAARALFDEHGEPSGRPYLARQYEDLRRQYEDLRRQYEDLRRPFAVTANDQYTDVWTYATVPHRRDKHPCEKPREMARDIVRISSRSGDVVLVLFSGSGVFAAEAVRQGRRAIAVEMDPFWAERTRLACEEAERAVA